MVLVQQNLEVMCADAKKRFRQTRSSNCVHCGTLIKCDMYRHVAKFHLDLAQLWRCPVSWCTVWKGTPQDCMDHVRGAHNVPWVVKSANIEQFVPPWTVHRQVWLDSLKAGHSGISTDILIFSDINPAGAGHVWIVWRSPDPHASGSRGCPGVMASVAPCVIATVRSGAVVSATDRGFGQCGRASLG